MQQSNKAIPYKWFEEVWNKGNEEVIDELFAEDGVAHGLTDKKGHQIVGPTDYKPFYRSFRNAIPDVKITLEQVIEEDDFIAMRFTLTGTHTGTGLGIEATNKEVSITGMSFIRVKDGKIADAWNVIDYLNMYQQIGISKPPVTFK